jgi:hypothetical protein
LCRDLTRRLDLTIACAALDDFEVSHLVFGRNGSAPFLTVTPQLLDVPGLPRLPKPGAQPSSAHSYVGTLVATMHDFAESHFAVSDFDHGISNQRRPPVFRDDHAAWNVIVPVTTYLAHLRVGRE